MLGVGVWDRVGDRFGVGVRFFYIGPSYTRFTAGEFEHDKLTILGGGIEVWALGKGLKGWFREENIIYY